MATPVDITPEAKVGAILARWPALEPVLETLSPRARALSVPVLRRTVVRVATVRQLARMAGCPVGEAVARLRAAAGLPAARGPGADAGRDRDAPPPWADRRAVRALYDARPALAAGEHPMPAVMRALAELGERDVLALVTPMVPAPLADLARAKGYESVSVVEGPDLVRTYFRRQPAAGAHPAPP